MITIAQIIDKINSWIVPNGSKQITANKMNEILQDLAKNNLIAFPAMPELTDSDIGKLVMNNGSAVEVARRNGVVGGRQGHWLVTFNDHFPVPQASSIEMQFGTTMSEGDTIRLLNRTYRFTSSPNFQNDVLIEVDNEAQADSFCNRLNADLGNYLTASMVISSTVKLLFDGENAPMVEDLNEKGKFLANFELDAMIDINCVNAPTLNNYTEGVLYAMEYDYSGNYQFCAGAVGIAAKDMLQKVMGSQGMLMWGLNFPTTPEEMANNFAIAVNSQGSDFTATVIGDGTLVEIYANVESSKSDTSDIVIIDEFLTQASIETLSINTASSETSIPFSVLGQLQGFIMQDYQGNVIRHALIKTDGIIKVKLNGSVNALTALDPSSSNPISVQMFQQFGLINEGGVECLLSAAPDTRDIIQLIETFKNIYVFKSNAETGEDVLVQKIEGLDFIMGLQLLGA